MYAVGVQEIGPITDYLPIVAPPPIPRPLHIGKTVIPDTKVLLSHTKYTLLPPRTSWTCSARTPQGVRCRSVLAQGAERLSSLVNCCVRARSLLPWQTRACPSPDREPLVLVVQSRPPLSPPPDRSSCSCCFAPSYSGTIAISSTPLSPVARSSPGTPPARSSIASRASRQSPPPEPWPHQPASISCLGALNLLAGNVQSGSCP